MSQAQDQAKYTVLSRLRPLILIGCALLILVVAFDMQQHGARLPGWDDWYLTVPLAVSVQDDTFQPGDLFIWYNGHRHVFTLLATAFFTWATDWNIGLQMWLNPILTGIAAWVLLWTIARRYGTPFAWWMGLPVVALLFTLRSRFTWLFAFQSGFPLAVLFFALSLAFACAGLPTPAIPTAKGRIRPFFLTASALCALGATFSVGSGLLCWFAVGAALWLLGYPPRVLLLWVIAAGSVIILFLSGDSALPGGSLLWQYPLSAVLYLLLYLISPFFPLFPTTPIPFFIMGVVGSVLTLALFVLNIVALWRREGKALVAIPVALMLFTCGSGLLTAYSRLGDFLQSPIQVFSERYVILIVPFWIGLFILIVRNLTYADSILSPVQGQLTNKISMQPRGWLSSINRVFIALLTPLYGVASISAGMSSFNLIIQRDECIATLPFFGASDAAMNEMNCLQPVQWVENEVWKPGVMALMTRRLNVFALPTLDVPVPSACGGDEGCAFTLPGGFDRLVLLPENASTSVAPFFTASGERIIGIINDEGNVFQVSEIPTAALRLYTPDGAWTMRLYWRT